MNYHDAVKYLVSDDCQPTQIIQERDTTHGPYDRTAARAQTLKTSTREGTNWHGMEPWARESLEMIEHKRARILEGNWRTEDHWLDIAGYAMLVVNLLRGET
jgi:hypothetical protein